MEHNKKQPNGREFSPLPAREPLSALMSPKPPHRVIGQQERAFDLARDYRFPGHPSLGIVPTAAPG